MVSRTKVETDTSGGDWSEPMNSIESAGFLITSLCSIDGGDTVFVAGIRDGGAAVIQMWSYSPRANGWQVRYPIPASIDQLGTPAPQAGAVTTLAGDGPWADVSAIDEDLPLAVRKTVYSKPGAVIYGLDADPQGRYLIAYDLNGQETLQVDLTQEPSVTTVLANISTQPQMDIAGHIRVADFLGVRGVVFRRMMLDVQAYAEVYTVATDLDNDGIFESWASYSEEAWAATPYSDWSQWSLFEGL